MSLNVKTVSENYTSNYAHSAKVTDTATKTSEKEVQPGATYEKADEASKSTTYKINKMSAEERANLVSRLKADQESRQNQLISLVQQMFSKQATTYGQTDESMWKFLASGKFTVDAATKAQAIEDISEDGYWGVKQTSQRLFDFASALAGDDVEKMKEMQAAMEKGFKLATKAWGRELPSISHDTMAAANKLFEDYYASKQNDME